MDAARTAKRLGATETLIVYRRDRAHMPAHAFEADEALEEGVKIKWLTTIKEIAGPELTVERMELDEDGRPQPTGEFETLTADAVVLALGQQTDSHFLRPRAGHRIRRRRCGRGGAGLMTGACRHLRRWRHGAGRAVGDAVGRPRQAGRAPHRRLAERRATRRPKRHRPRQLSTCCICRSIPTLTRSAQPQLEALDAR